MAATAEEKKANAVEVPPNEPIGTDGKLAKIYGARKGKVSKAVRLYSFTGFDPAKDFANLTLNDILEAVKNDEPTLVKMAAIGYNKVQADSVADQFYGLIPASFVGEQRTSLKIAAREIMKALGKTPEQAVKMILAA